MAVAGLAVALAALLAPSAVNAGPGHTGLPTSVPSAKTPNIMSGSVQAIYDAGEKIIVGGTFSTVQNRNTTTNISRPNVLAFNKATGVVDTAFAPVVNGHVLAVVAGPLPGTVLIAGKFTKVNGVNRPKLAVLNVADGSIVTSFASPPINGVVNDVVRAGDRYLVGGVFTTVQAQPRKGLASLDANTGALDTYLNVQLTEHHNYDGSSNAAFAPVGASKLAVSPDGGQLVVIGNFKKANGVLHDQVVKLDLGPASATIAAWNTSGYTPRCSWTSFDSWIRDVAYSPDGTYFVIVTTGAPVAGTLCDTAARWESGATGTNVQPTWVNFTGGDTLLSVGISETAVFVGGHQRWLNNSFGADFAGQGAVARPGLAALDPANGLPLKWNPGRNPRGVGAAEVYLTSEGVWIGSDTKYIGNRKYRRDRIAFFPMTGGYAPHPTNTAALPGKVYQNAASTASNVVHRVNTGGPAIGAIDGGPDWSSDTNAAPWPWRTSGSNEAAWGSTGNVGPTVPSSTPATLFQYERWDPTSLPNMQFDFPVAAGTQVEVRLYFSNRCSCTASPGQRRFDVYLDGVKVLDNFDVSATAGHNTGLMRSFTRTSDGTIDVDFAQRVENPMVSGIEIVKTGAPPAANNDLSVRSYDGATSAGPLSPVPNPDGITWSTVKGAFWVGGTLFYGQGGTLNRRSFDGTTFGPASVLDPYHDPLWDSVDTGSGQTYQGSTVNFYGELGSVTGMFYSAGRLYYTLSGQSGLFYRYFTPDSGIVGPDKFTVPGASGFTESGGVFVANGKLYLANRNTGTLSVTDWAGAPAGSFAVVSGPAIDGQDWRARTLFVAP